MNPELSFVDDVGRTVRERDGKTQGGYREGKERLTGGESSDELTRTKTKQIEAGGRVDMRGIEGLGAGAEEASKYMEERVLKTAREFRKDPSAVTKKTVEAIKQMGVRPDSRLVAKLAAHIVAYRQESRGGARELSMIRGCRRRCAQWWRSTELNTKGGAS
jgi:hypothetical protein